MEKYTYVGTANVRMKKNTANTSVKEITANANVKKLLRMPV